MSVRSTRSGLFGFGCGCRGRRGCWRIGRVEFWKSLGERRRRDGAILAVLAEGLATSSSSSRSSTVTMAVDIPRRRVRTAATERGTATPAAIAGLFFDETPLQSIESRSYLGSYGTGCLLGSMWKLCKRNEDDVDCCCMNITCFVHFLWTIFLQYTLYGIVLG